MFGGGLQGQDFRMAYRIGVQFSTVKSLGNHFALIDHQCADGHIRRQSLFRALHR